VVLADEAHRHALLDSTLSLLATITTTDGVPEAWKQ
jgi:hypothetical protein